MLATIHASTKAVVLERDEFTCQMCGHGVGDRDPSDRRRKVRMTVRLITDDEPVPDNLRAICTNCNEGLQKTAPPKPNRMELMRQLRRATIADQRHALEWLGQKFSRRQND